jgi:hypothetical protein
MGMSAGCWSMVKVQTIVEVEVIKSQIGNSDYFLEKPLSGKGAVINIFLGNSLNIYDNIDHNYIINLILRLPIAIVKHRAYI